MNIFSKLHVLFKSISIREKVLFCGFAWIIALLWGTAMIKKLNDFRMEWRIASSNTKQQNMWINNSTFINEKLNDVLQIIDPKKSYGRTQFAGKVEELAKKAELNYSTNSPKTHNGDIFDAHTIRIHFNEAPIENLIAFDEMVGREKPYLGLDNIKITADVYNPQNLTASFTLTAVQLKELKEAPNVPK